MKRKPSNILVGFLPEGKVNVLETATHPGGFRATPTSLGLPPALLQTQATSFLQLHARIVIRTANGFTSAH